VDPPLFFANILLRSAILKYEKSGRCTCLKAETKMKSLFSLLACCPYFSWQAGGKANWWTCWTCSNWSTSSWKCSWDITRSMRRKRRSNLSTWHLWTNFIPC